MDHAARLKAYIDLANSERQAIWSRNAAMLVANSFLLNAANNAPSSAIAALFSLGGVVICASWTLLTVEGWNILYRHNKMGAAIDVGEGLNPMSQQSKGRSGEKIFWCTQVIVLTFFVLNAYSLANYVNRAGFFAGEDVSSAPAVAAPGSP